MKNFIEFGILKDKKKKKYEKITGNLYDDYMLLRYFKDIYFLELAINDKSKRNTIHKEIHARKDLKFNLITYVLILTSKTYSFYEFGSTILEKIFYFKLFDKMFDNKLAKRITYIGTEPSNKFNFFVKNFFQNYNINIFKNFNKKISKKSIFFAKGISLLYEKKNYDILKYIVTNFKAGQFDLSLTNRKKISNINSGLKLNYISKKKFINILKIKNKKFIIRNKKKVGDKIYFEIIFGNKNIINNFLTKYNKIRKDKKFKHFGVNENFKVLSLNNNFLF
tara:strand:- start:232 stop:1068 length:837 start_codon:yes stop_codon:yes gene_type:complete